MGGTGGVAVLAVGVVAWLAWRRRWRAALAGLIAVAATDLVCARALKPLVERPRPCAVDHQLEERVSTVGVECGSGWSFPSNHAANTAALAAATGSGGLALVAVGVGASRIALGQHYPSDVAAGWVVGAAIGLGVARLARPRKGR